MSSAFYSSFYPADTTVGVKGSAAFTSTAISGYLTNENLNVAADVNGGSYSLVGAGGTFKVFNGTTDVTTTSTTFSVVAPATKGNLTMSIDSAGVYSLTGASWNTDSETFTLQALHEGVTIELVYSISKSKAGATGAPAKTLNILSNRQTIVYNAAGSSTPTTQTTTFTANKQNTTATVTWSVTDSNGVARTPTATYLSAATGDSVTMTEAQFASARNGTSGVIVTGTLTDGTTFTDRAGLVRIQEGQPGASPILASLSTSSASVPSNSDGSSPDFTGVSTTLSIFEGTTDVTSSWTIAQTLSTGLTGTGSGTPTFVPTGFTQNNGTVTFTATRSGFPTQTAVFTISKARAGVNGTVGSSPITIRLTNPAVSVPTDTNGDNGTYTGSGTSIYVQEGQTVLDFNGSGTNGTNGNLNGGTTAGTWKIESRVATGVTLGSIQADSAVFATVNQISLISADTGSIVYTITGRNLANTAFTIEVTQNFSRVKGVITDTTPPGAPTGLALTSSTSTLDGGNVVSRLLATWTANTETDLSYYEAEISEASGSYIGFTTATNRFEWVAKANVSYSVRVRAVDKNNNKSAYSTVVSHTTGRDTVAPSVPTSFTGTGAFENIFLSWTNAADSDLAGVIIYSSTSNDRTTATELARVNALPSQKGVFTHSSLTPGTTRYYWLRSVDTSGNLSTAFTPNTIAGLAASTSLLAADKLADEALNAERLFSDTLRPVEVFNGSLPSTGNFEGRQGYLYGSATPSNNGKLHRYVSGVWTKAVDGGDITVNTITAGAISAGAILASKLAIGDLSNQIDNASFELGDTLWTKGTGWTIASDSATALRGTWRASRAATGTTSALSDTDTIPVLEGDIWAAEAMLRTTSGATGGGFVRITALNSLGGVVATLDGTSVSNTTTYTVSRATYTVPAGASTIRVDVIGNNTVGILYVDEIRLLRVSGTTLIADGAITTNKIVANSINGDRITANTLNADKIVAGTITGDRFNTGTSLPGTITVGATGVSIGTVQTNAASGAAVATNFNANNDRNATTPTAPTIPAAGAAVDHVVNTDGSVDISFEWNYTTSTVATDANNIDGFFVYVRSSTSATAYTFGTDAANESVFTLPSDRRALVIQGAAANRHYTFGVQAYRAVDSDINSTGVVRSSIIKSVVSGEDPYQPSTSVAFAGNITGTVDGTAATTVVSNAALGAQNPTTRINAGTTTIDPGKILISGSTTLANWRNGSNQTLIEGGSIAANTVSANKIEIGSRGLDIAGLQFQAQLNGVSNRVDWSPGTIIYTDDAGVVQTPAISGGNAIWSGSTVYIYWVKGSTTLATSTATGTAYGANNIVLATYRGGVDLVVNYGRTIIDGSQITTETIAANQIKAGAITTSKLLVSSAGGYNPDPMFYDSSYWKYPDINERGPVVIKLYKRGSSTDIPTAATYRFDTATIANTGTWSSNVPGGLGTLWVIAASAYLLQQRFDTEIENTYTFGSAEWGTPIADTTDTGNGTSATTLRIYARNNSTTIAPTGPTTTGTYNFSTGVLTNIGTTWTLAIPGWTDVAPRLWVRHATAHALTATAPAITSDTNITSSEWRTARRGENGAWYLEENSTVSNNMGVPRMYAMWEGVRGNAGHRMHVYAEALRFSGRGQELRLRANAWNASNQNLVVDVLLLDINRNFITSRQLFFNAGSGYSIGSTIITIPSNANIAWYQLAIYNEGAATFEGAVSVSDIKLDTAAGAELIVDGSITAGKIQAGSITTSKLSVGDISILNRNSDFEDGDVNWVKEGSWIIVNNDSANARTGTWVSKITGSGSFALRSVVIPTQTGEAFSCDGWLKTSASGVTSCVVRISGVNSSGFEIWTAQGNVLSGSTTTYTRSFGNFTVPANVVGVRVEVVATITGGTVWADNIRIFRAATGELIVNGAVTSDKITVTQLSAISATIGTLRTATTGARTEISDNVIKVFDASNVLRVRIGNLTL